MKKINKPFMWIAIVEAIIIALGIFGLMCLNDYRSGILTIPPTIKDIAVFILGLALWFGVVFGVFGWGLFINYIVECRQNDRNGNSDSIRNGSLPNFNNYLASCGDDLASLHPQEKEGQG